MARREKCPSLEGRKEEEEEETPEATLDYVVGGMAATTHKPERGIQRFARSVNVKNRRVAFVAG